MHEHKEKETDLWRENNKKSDSQPQHTAPALVSLGLDTSTYSRIPVEKSSSDAVMRTLVWHSVVFVATKRELLAI